MIILEDVKRRMDSYKLKRKIGNVVSNLCRYIFLIAFSYVLIYPILFLLSKSFQGALDAYDPTVQWVPKNFTTANIVNAFGLIDYGKSILSTVFNMLIAGGIEVLTCLIFAYGLARYEFKGKKILTALMILTILIPSSMTIIPNYLNMQKFDLFGLLGLVKTITGTDLRPSLIDSPLAFYLPSLLGVGLRGGLFIFIYSQFFKGLPKELEEAAWIDGAGLYKTLFGVVVPSSGVAIITVSMLSIIWHWNEYYLPQLFLSSNFPLSVNLANIQQRATSFVALKTPYMYNLSISAACLLVITPMLIYYLIFQRKFISSIATSGIVG